MTTYIITIQMPSHTSTDALQNEPTNPTHPSTINPTTTTLLHPYPNENLDPSRIPHFPRVYRRFRARGRDTMCHACASPLAREAASRARARPADIENIFIWRRANWALALHPCQWTMLPPKSVIFPDCVRRRNFDSPPANSRTLVYLFSRARRATRSCERAGESCSILGLTLSLWSALAANNTW